MISFTRQKSVYLNKTKSLTLMASFTDKELGELVHGNNAEQTFYGLFS